MTCAIIACLKQEELYIKEWLDWHINIGVDHFYLCDNNDKDYEPKLSDVVKEYIDKGIVEVFDYSGVHPIQPICYDDIYQKYRTLYDWWIIIDIDEFIFIPKCSNNLKQYINNVPDYVNLIYMCWENYGDNDLIYYDDRPCLERFTKPINGRGYHDIVDWEYGHTENLLGKSLFRSSCTDCIRSQHNINNIIQNMYDGNFNNITEYLSKNNKVKTKCINNPYLSIYIKHFRTKSLEEWCWRYQRGDTFKTKNDERYPYFLQNFWTFNERTPEKEKYMKEYRKQNNLS